MLEKCIVNTNSTWYKIIKAKPSYICSLPSEVTALNVSKITVIENKRALLQRHFIRTIINK